MTGWLPRGAAEIFGEGAEAADTYDLLTVDVPAGAWTAALRTARDELGCTFFDWLSAVDEPGTGFRICAHLVALDGGVRRLLVRTTVPYEAAALPTATGVYAGAAWHERETHEMFGVDFTGHPGLAPLLLPDEFEGHPLRKDFVLAARVAKAWPGAKEPGESHDGGPKRRQMLPPGVPDPNEWGPLKGQLPPPPTRAARSATTSATRPPRTPRTTPPTPEAPWQPPRPPAPAGEAPPPSGKPAVDEPPAVPPTAGDKPAAGEPPVGREPSAAGEAAPSTDKPAAGEAPPPSGKPAAGEPPAVPPTAGDKPAAGEPPVGGEPSAAGEAAPSTDKPAAGDGVPGEGGKRA